MTKRFLMALVFIFATAGLVLPVLGSPGNPTDAKCLQGFAITATPTSATVQRGQNATFGVTMTTVCKLQLSASVRSSGTSPAVTNGPTVFRELICYHGFCGFLIGPSPVTVNFVMITKQGTSTSPGTTLGTYIQSFEGDAHCITGYPCPTGSPGYFTHTVNVTLTVT